MRQLYFIKLVLVVIAVSGCVKGHAQRQYSKILQYTTRVLENRHYNSLVIDDAFSRDLFTAYLQKLDPENMIFLPEDITALQPYAMQLDDELHGKAPVAFVAVVYKKYQERVTDLLLHYNTMPAWQQRLLRQQAEQYIVLKQAEGESKRKKGQVMTSDAELQEAARLIVQKKTTAWLTRLKERFPVDMHFNMYVNCVTAMADPHTEYFPPDENQAFMDYMGGRSTGIGVKLSSNGDEIRIDELLDGGPASNSGMIQEGDVIVAVVKEDNKEVEISGYDITEVSRLLRGSKGSPVTLKLRKADGKTNTLTLVRDEINPESRYARSAVMEERGRRIGYLQLPGFYFAERNNPTGHNCSADVLAALKKLKVQQVESLVFDIRDNGGGSLPEVVKIIGYFVGAGPAVQIVGRNGTPRMLGNDDSSKVWDGPLVVLINGKSASAAELFAAAMQDYERGVIAGSNSFGKGTVQAILPMGRDTTESKLIGSIKITTDKFYRINGSTTQLQGVTPDVSIPIVYDERMPAERKMLHALGADDIPPAGFAVWKTGYDCVRLIQQAQQLIDHDKHFHQIVHLSARLKIELDHQKEQPLTDIAIYGQQQDTIKKLRNTLSALQKAPRSLLVKPAETDTPMELQPSLYKKWLQDKGNDPVLQSAVQIAMRMNDSGK